MGSGAVLTQMENPRIGADANVDLMLMWKALLGGWEPPDTLSEAEYAALRHAPSSALRAFAGFGCSFSGKWFGGYARGAVGRNYAKEAKNASLRDAQLLAGTDLVCGDYAALSPHGALIYCDPPYAGTTGYGSGVFDSARFWRQVREWARTNTVVVSEYNAPVGFVPVLEIPRNLEMRRGGGRAEQRVERLFQEAEHGMAGGSG